MRLNRKILLYNHNKTSSANNSTLQTGITGLTSIQYSKAATTLSSKTCYPRGLMHFVPISKISIESPPIESARTSQCKPGVLLRSHSLSSSIPYKQTNWTPFCVTLPKPATHRYTRLSLSKAKAALSTLQPPTTTSPTQDSWTPMNFHQR